MDSDLNSEGFLIIESSRIEHSQGATQLTLIIDQGSGFPDSISSVLFILSPDISGGSSRGVALNVSIDNKLRYLLKRDYHSVGSFLYQIVCLLLSAWQYYDLKISLILRLSESESLLQK